MTSRAPLSLVDHERLHQMETVKLPPHSVEAEQSVLGSLLLDNTALDRVSDLVAEADFYRADHRLIYKTIVHLIEGAMRQADVITVAERLEQLDKLEDIGGLAYLGALAQNTPTAANVRTYAGIVRGRSLLRGLAEAATQIAESAYHPLGREPQALLADAESRIFALGERAGKSGQEPGFVDMPPILTKVVEVIDTLYHKDNPDDITGVPTGLYDLDQALSGLQPGDLIVIGARPSMGKTALALNIAAHVGVEVKLPVGIFSMEMPQEALAMRILCSRASLNYHLVRKGRMQDDDWRRLTHAVGELSEAPIHIDETAAISPMDLASRARRLCRQYGKLGLLVVDYIQLMGVDGLGDTRAGDIGVASRSLKKLAKELNVPVVALSQINRGVENRPNKRPNMSDLRESGDIEQDADVVIFLYRDEVYNDDSQNKGTAELIVAKQRNGPIGTSYAAWQGHYMRFVNRAYASQAREPGSDDA